MKYISEYISEKTGLSKEDKNGLVDLLSFRAQKKTQDELREHVKKGVSKWPLHPVFEHLLVEEGEAFLDANGSYPDISSARKAVLHAFRNNSFRGPLC